MTLRVLVLDDRRPEKIADAVRTGAEAAGLQVELATLGPADLADAIPAFFRMVKARLSGEDAPRDGAVSGLFGHDLMLVDNNLAMVPIEGARLTAEALVGYLRAFTDVGYLVSLNKNPVVDFDLRFLVGDFETRADLAINAQHLELPRLWSWSADPGEDVFCPWYWPELGRAHQVRSGQDAFVRHHLGSPILGSLGFSSRAIEGLSRQAVSFLSHQAGGVAPATGVTFWDHFRFSGRTLPSEERAGLAFPTMAADEREKALSDAEAPPAGADLEAIARIVAAEFDLWFRRDLLGPQDSFVDLPHLLARLRVAPEGLDRDAAAASWACALSDGSLEPALGEAFVEGVANGAAFRGRSDEGDPDYAWPLDRPVWFWPDIEAEEGTATLRADPTRTSVSLAFHEDTREFAPRDQEHKVFVPESNPFLPRYVRDVADYVYSPGSRFVTDED